MKFYSAQNSNQRIAGVAFEPVDVFAGTLIGVFSTDDTALQAELAKHPNVAEISEDEYGSLLKKKAPALKEFSRLNVNHKSSLPEPAIKETVGVVVENPASGPMSSNIPTADLLEARPIETPPTIGRRKAK